MITLCFGNESLPLTLGNIWKYFCFSAGSCKLLIALFLPRCTSECTAERDRLNARLAIKASRSWLTSRSTIWYTQEKNPTSVRYVTHHRDNFPWRPRGQQGSCTPRAGHGEGSLAARGWRLYCSRFQPWCSSACETAGWPLACQSNICLIQFCHQPHSKCYSAIFE